MEQKEIQIKNKKALFNYDISEKYIAGITLLGTEIKSVRNASVTLSSSFCVSSSSNKKSGFEGCKAIPKVS